jgi:hypothetical protein
LFLFSQAYFLQFCHCNSLIKFLLRKFFFLHFYLLFFLSVSHLIFPVLKKSIPLKRNSYKFLHCNVPFFVKICSTSFLCFQYHNKKENVYEGLKWSISQWWVRLLKWKDYWRYSVIFLNSNLAYCSGLDVVWVHPPKIHLLAAWSSVGWYTEVVQPL